MFSASTAFKNIKENLESNSLVHAYLFLSTDALNNALFVKETSKLILCDQKSGCSSCPSCLKVLAESHPDLLQYPKNKNFLVEDANDITVHSIEKPILSEKKIIIINNIDEATVQAQNKILKTLEEPAKSVIFFLTAKNESKILPTIISRTRKINLSPISTDEIKKYISKLPNRYENKLLETALTYGDGWIGKTVNALQSSSFLLEKQLANEIVKSFNSSKDISIFSSKVLVYKDTIRSFLNLLSSAFAKELTSDSQQKKEGTVKIIQEINLANQNLDRYVNINLIVDNLLMKILEYKYIYQLQ